MSWIYRIQDPSRVLRIVMDVINEEIFSLLARWGTNGLDVENVHIWDPEFSAVPRRRRISSLERVLLAFILLPRKRLALFLTLLPLETPHC